MEDEFYAFLDEVRILAQVGLEYADDPYDEARYARLLERASDLYGRSVDLPPATVRSRFAADVGRVTPKVSADAAVFDDDGRVLVQRRTDDGTWCLPGGYTDPNESPRETAVRETREETGLVVEPEELVDVFTRKPGAYGPHCLVVHVYRCSVVDGERSTSHEGDAVRYHAIDDVDDWHKNHAAEAEAGRRAWQAT